MKTRLAKVMMAYRSLRHLHITHNVMVLWSTLLDMIATTSWGHPLDWHDQLPKVCMAYNTSVHASTGYTPDVWTTGQITH